MFQTPSWSGKDEVYEVLVKSSDWSVRCNCFGANRWKKVGYAQHPDLSDCCQHERAVIRLIERHLRDESPTDQQD